MAFTFLQKSNDKFLVFQLCPTSISSPLISKLYSFQHVSLYYHVNILYSCDSEQKINYFLLLVLGGLFLKFIFINYFAVITKSL